MATTPVNTNTPASTPNLEAIRADSEILQEHTTYVIVEDKENKRKTFPESEETDQKIAEGEYKEMFRQTFNFPQPQNFRALQVLIPDLDEVYNLAMRGLSTKLQNKARTSVLAKDFAPVDGVIDLTTFAGEKSDRRLSPLEKTMKSVDEFDAETKKQLLALMLKQAKEAGIDINSLVG